MIGNRPDARKAAKYAAYKAVREHCVKAKVMMPRAPWQDWTWAIGRDEAWNTDVITFSPIGFEAKVIHPDGAVAWHCQTVFVPVDATPDRFAIPTSIDELAEVKAAAFGMIREHCAKFKKLMPKIAYSKWEWTDESNKNMPGRRVMAVHDTWRACVELDMHGMPSCVSWVENPWSPSKGCAIPKATVTDGADQWLDDVLATHENDPPPDSLLKVTKAVGKTFELTAEVEEKIAALGLAVPAQAKPKPKPKPAATPANVMPAWMHGAGRPGRRVDV